MNQAVESNSFIQLEASELIGLLIPKEKAAEIRKYYRDRGYVVVYSKFESESKNNATNLDVLLKIFGSDQKYYDKTNNLQYKLRYLLGRALIKHTLNSCLGIPIEQIKLQYGIYGKPFLSGAAKEIDFNLSHTENILVLAVTNLGLIGIDIESTSRKIDQLNIAEIVCADFELQKLKSLPKESHNSFLLQLWTLKEAFTKSLGLGLYKPFNSFGIVNQSSHFQLVELEKTEELSDKWLFYSDIFQENYRLSIALENR